VARSLLFAGLQRLYTNLARTNATNDRLSYLATRREVLSLAGTAAAAALVSPRPGLAALKPSIAILGGGISGLLASLTLLNAGYRSTVYEASRRVGGRMHSDTTSWLNNQVTEHCGELIDSDHTLIIRLARQHNIGLIDLSAVQPKNADDTYFFRGEYYARAKAEEDFAPVFAALTRDQNAVGDSTTFDRHNAAGQMLDSMSAYEWIERNVPGGHRSPMGRLIDIAYDIEYGAPTQDQSALNVVYLLSGQSDPKQFSMFGSSDEKYHMSGGNERLPRAIATELERRAPGTIRLSSRLTTIVRGYDGTYRLSLQTPSGTSQVAADYVILGIPFSTLRTVDYTQAGFDDRKKKAIAELGYGTNVKLQLQFSGRPWREQGPWGISTGETFTDIGYQNTWEVTRGQAGNTGILVNYMGSAGAAISGNPANPALIRYNVQRFLRQLETVFPGITTQWNGRAVLDAPTLSPFLRGSYSFWRVGQYTTIAGAEKLSSGQCHFAGEHCSTDFQGYMEGAAREGVRAAQELLATLK
jgi:monoamine oxidase